MNFEPIVLGLLIATIFIAFMFLFCSALFFHAGEPSKNHISLICVYGFSFSLVFTFVLTAIYDYIDK